MEDVLKEAGYTNVIAAASAREAFEILGINHKNSMEAGKGLHADLILMDIVMPDMEGIEACRIIHGHETQRDVPIIMVTASDDLENLTRAFAAGAMDYCHKPIKKVELLARINSALAFKREADRRKARELELLEMTSKLASANKRLRLISSQDGLTQLANRRLFDETLTQEWRRAIRQENPLTIIMIDIDYFKLFNDTYGHLAGDDCLKRVAAALNSRLRRAGDLLARYGGEEFVMLLPNTDRAGARLLAEDLRDSVEQMLIPHEQSNTAPVVTVSLGGASMLPRTDLPSRALIQAADEALYQSKENGRNQVTWSPKTQ
jgi:diguanylate cyclase (GGDEF)-like protein